EDRTEGQPPGMEPERDVDEDPKQGEAQGQRSAGLELVADLRPDDIQLLHLRIAVDRLQYRLEPAADGRRILSRIGRQPDRHITGGAEALHLRLLEARLDQLRAYRLDIRSLRESRSGADATREVDSQVQTPGGE